MLRWFIVIFLALLIITGLTPLLKKLGLGRLPGDFTLRLGQRQWFIPLGSTVVLSFIASLVSHFI